MKRRNCNLELRLVTPSVFYHSSDYNNAQYHSMLDMHMDMVEEKQQLTIFYNGRVANCDVTELQARSIISLASREMEDEKRKILSLGRGSSEPCSPDISPIDQSCRKSSSGSGLSMKRSLQSFLQKRKSRVQAISPYPIHNRTTTS
ncbi:protein TIFY 5A [Sesamum alatum]|uniref:Protein TIFY n=1 Tax=Sesamum alatum TaxID=300844 RepID=A0AAE2CZB4_9LAMI|nr:protein TIFY 5A [Sesamum alatum]